MSQYPGYYTSSKQDSPPPSSIPYIDTADDDFEYDDKGYTNFNKRSHDEVEADNSYNQNLSLNLDQTQVKHQKLNNYYSSSSNNSYGQTSNFNNSSSNNFSNYHINSSNCNNVSSNFGNFGNFSSYSSNYNSTTNNSNSFNGCGTSSQRNIDIGASSYSLSHSRSSEDKPYIKNTSSSSCNSQIAVPKSTHLIPELSMPVFQTADLRNDWEAMMPSAVTAGQDDITVRSEKSEQWAWGNGRKWVGPAGPRPKLNTYSGAPSIHMFQTASRVTGGIGEKLLQKMGWKEGEGLGRTKDGDTEPIQFMEIKTDRKGLVSREDGGHAIVQAKCVEEIHKSKFSAIKSTSFWNWHGTGMKGPENVKDRIKTCKKEAKEKAPIDLTGKHPVSALMELCSKKRWKDPKFVSEISPTGFKFKVEVNGTPYTPSSSSDNKKIAKAESAKNCLVQMGLWTL